MALLLLPFINREHINTITNPIQGFVGGYLPTARINDSLEVISSDKTINSLFSFVGTATSLFGPSTVAAPKTESNTHVSDESQAASTEAKPLTELIHSVASSPQIQTFLATAAAIIGSSLIQTFRNQSPSELPLAVPTQKVNVPQALPLTACFPSPSVNNQLNFSRQTTIAAMMQIMAVRLAESHVGANGQNTIRKQQQQIPTTSPSGTLTSLSLTAIPTVVMSALGTLATSLFFSSPKPSELPVKTQTANGALPLDTEFLSQPMKEQLKAIAKMAGRNVALAVLYYALVKYLGPAGLSVRVSFTMATILMDLLI